MTDSIEHAVRALLAELVPTSPSAAPGQNMLAPNARCDAGETPLWRAHAGPATLFVHGWNDTHRIWRQFAQDFIVNSRPVLLMDLPGHGASKSADFGGEAAGQSVYAVCEAEARIDAFLAKAQDFAADSFAIPTQPEPVTSTTLSPSVEGCDGFFIARLKRLC
jgi:hypothetical protein